MKKVLSVLFSIFGIYAIAQSTGGKTMDTASLVSYARTPILSWESEENIEGKPKWKGFLLIKAKFNGVYDISGGLQDQETFNVNRIDPWGTNDDDRLWMDLHQTQIRLWSSRETEGGTFVGYLEMDAWGGNNHVRLRHAWFDYKFVHFGQDWTFFGDKDIWPNVMDWDGPPSGVWRREPQVKFYWASPNLWKFEGGIELPRAEIRFESETGVVLDTNLTSAFQTVPDVIAAVRKTTNFGHIRLSGIARFMNYKDMQDINKAFGYGASLSGYVKTHKVKRNSFQFQITGGVGIAGYLVSFGGQNFDAVVNGYGGLETVPAVGSWFSYEHYFTDKWHANAVYGFSNFISPEISQFKTGGPEYQTQNSTIALNHQYFLLNLMFDPTPGLTLGIEYNHGYKQNSYEGEINTGEPLPLTEYSKDRQAQRISFGAFFDF